MARMGSTGERSRLSIQSLRNISPHDEPRLDFNTGDLKLTRVLAFSAAVESPVR